MTPCRITLIELGSQSEPQRSRINALGIESMLNQEGLPYVATNPGAIRDTKDSDLLLIAGAPDPTETESRYLSEIMRKSRFVWIGDAPTSGSLSRLIGTSGAKPEGVSDTLYAINIQKYPFSHTPLLPHEQRLKIKHCPVLAAPRRTAKDCEEIASIDLWDGKRLGPAILVSKRARRRVVIPFALGWAFVFNTSVHHHERFDLDMMDYPLQANADMYRNILRDAIVWTASPHFIIRPYYWPASDGKIPSGAFNLNHDACGFTTAGLRFIRKVCAREKVVTTFFDFPGERFSAHSKKAEFRTSKSTAKGHDVALHVEDATDFRTILKAKESLDATQGRITRGWRRHGPSFADSYPRVWHYVKRAGIKWTACWAPQSSPWLLLSEGTSTGNRLPYNIVDVEKAEEIGLLELPTFDSQDAERLSSFNYGQRLSWKEWERNVRTRFDHASRHNLLTGFLIHVWTAGVKHECGFQHGARDAQKMMEWTIQHAKKRGFCVLGHEQLYDWWTWRSDVRIDVGEQGANIMLPSFDYDGTFEILSHGAKIRSVSVNGKRISTTSSRVRASKMFTFKPTKLEDSFVIAVS